MTIFYAVKTDINPSIYTDKEKIPKLDNKFIKSFSNENDARAYLGFPKTEKTENDQHLKSYTLTKITNKSITNNFNLKDDEMVAYVDGSFNKSLNTYGSGVLIITKDDIYTIRESYTDRYVKYKFTSGEIMGAIIALDTAIDFGVKKITIYHDFMGIKNHKTMKWKCKNPMTKTYYQYLTSIRSLITYDFVHVKSHSGDYYNDIADLLAKDAVNLTEKEISMNNFTKPTPTLALNLDEILPEVKIKESTNEGEKEFIFNLALKAIKILRENSYGIITDKEDQTHIYNEVIVNNQTITYILENGRNMNASKVKMAQEDTDKDIKLNTFDINLITSALDRYKDADKTLIENIKENLKS